MCKKKENLKLNFIKKNLPYLLPLIFLPLIVFAAVVGVTNGQMCITDWIALCCGELAYIGTTILGAVTAYQNYKYKKIAEIKDKLLQEESEKARIQDLMLRANPCATFVEINNIEIWESIAHISNKGACNVLTANDYNKNVDRFNKVVYFELKFNCPSNHMIDRVSISELILDKSLYDDTIGSWVEEKHYNFVNKTISNNLSKFCIHEDGCFSAIALLLLRLDNADEKDIYESLKNEKYIWNIKMDYSVSNSFGLMTSYMSACKFELHLNEEQYSNITCLCVKNMDDITNIRTIGTEFNENLVV